MNILVTGANGQLGNCMRIFAKERTDKYIFTDVVGAPVESIDMLKRLAGGDINTNTEYLDITNLADIRLFVQKYNIDVIVNCAAYTNVEAAEDNISIAELLNAKSPEYLAASMKEVHGLLVHISTDYVFGKEPYNTPCKEDQQGTPTGIYGMTKLCGERAIQKVGCNYVILRTAWLYSEFGKNFVKTILDLIAKRPQLKVVVDQVGTPTYAADLAQAINIILDDYKTFSSMQSSKNYEKSGVYHFSDEGVCSWYDFAYMIAEYSGNQSCEIMPCHSTDSPGKVKRPSYSVLDKSKVKDSFGIRIPYWTKSLKNCLAGMNV